MRSRSTVEAGGCAGRLPSDAASREIQPALGRVIITASAQVAKTAARSKIRWSSRIPIPDCLIVPSFPLSPASILRWGPYLANKSRRSRRFVSREFQHANKPTRTKSRSSGLRFPPSARLDRPGPVRLLSVSAEVEFAFVFDETDSHLIEPTTSAQNITGEGFVSCEIDRHVE